MADFNFMYVNDIFQQMGIYDVVLPFLLAFTVVFAFLEKTKVLGNNPNVKKFNIVISIVMGLLLVRVEPLVYMINNALPKISAVIVGIVMFFILIAMFNGEQGIGGLFSKGMLKFIVGIAAVVVAWAFWSSYTGSNIPEWSYWIYDNLATIIVLGVFALVLVLITSGDKEKDDTEDVIKKRKEAYEAEQKVMAERAEKAKTGG